MLNLEGRANPATGSVPVIANEPPTPLQPLASMLEEQTKILVEIATMLFAIQDRLTGCQEKRAVTPPLPPGLLDAAHENRAGMLSILQTVHELSEMIG